VEPRSREQSRAGTLTGAVELAKLAASNVEFDLELDLEQ
jgi:hypothetical protein